MSGQNNHGKSTKGSSYHHILIVTYPTYITKFKFHDYQWNQAKVIKERQRHSNQGEQIMPTILACPHQDF